MILGRRSNGAGDDKPAVRVDSLAADHHLSYSALCPRLWPPGSAAAISTNCSPGSPVRGERGPTRHRRLHRPRRRSTVRSARLGYRDETLVRDGTAAPRPAWPPPFAAELEQSPLGPILVVTGGFHTAALPDLVAAGAITPGAADGRRRRGRHLAHAGTASTSSTRSAEVRLRDAQSRVLRPFVDGRRLRAAGPRRSPTSSWRSVGGHGRTAWPARPPRPTPSPPCRWPATALRRPARPPVALARDVLDAMRSCFIKGEVGTEGKSFCV